MLKSDQLQNQLREVMTRDYGRLFNQWRRIASAKNPPSTQQIEQLTAEIAASRACRQQRLAHRPAIDIDESLPIAGKRQALIDLIQSHQVLIVAGETGSGKTTQLPKLCLAAGRGSAGMIGCTQPRRLAARSVARRVAVELNTQIGHMVGFQVRFTDQVGENTLIKFMTDGILLAETQSEPWLSAYDTLILDEAHERSLNIDFLLGYLKRLLVKRRDLKLIVTSATINTDRFAAHFDQAPVVHIEGRTYPVEVRWRPLPPRGEASMSEHITTVLDEITQQDPQGDVLIFLPGEREIRDAHLVLAQRHYRETEILPLYARLSAADQDRVFHPGVQRRIVLATNVAETSLTVPRIRYVVDSGNARIKRYTQRSQLERLHIEPISQAAAEQRKGRCGRVGPGVCFRLYDEEDYQQRPAYTDPEIFRSSLSGVILRMLSLRLGDIENFPFIDAPQDRAIGDGYRRLTELGAIDAQRHLTSIGHALAKLPIDVALARMLVEAPKRHVLRELLILVSFLSVQDPRERPADMRQAADTAHAHFTDPKSDFISILNFWNAYNLAHEDLTQSKLRAWCQTHFLSFLRMREWREIHRQLLLITNELGWLDKAEVTPASSRATEKMSEQHSTFTKTKREHESENKATLHTALNYEAIHRCLLSGWPTQIGLKDERGQYRSTRERRFHIFPASTLAKTAPQWVLAGQIIDLQKIYGLMCAKIEPQWVEQQAPHLIKRNWHDVHWSRKRGAVVAYEQVTLFGLTLVEKRTLLFSRQDEKLAHQIFLDQALARCEIDGKADFLQANARVLAQAYELEAKQRRSGLLRSEQELAAFFAGKLPQTINTTVGLDAWYRKAPPAEQAAVHWTLEDIVASAVGLRAQDFPTDLECAGHSLRCDYRFIPGDPADGITLYVPLALLNVLSTTRCEWLVPGLLTDKVTELIRGLPKALRRNFVPAPDFARAFVEAEPASENSLLVVLASYLNRITGVEIRAEDFAKINLPAHLYMNFCVFDEQGNTLAMDRNIALTQAKLTDAARSAFSRRAHNDLLRETVTHFDFTDIPETIITQDGIVAFPALVDLGESVALQIFELADTAMAAHVKGVERLLRRSLSDKIKQAGRQLPIDKSLALKYAGIASVDALREDLIEAALQELLALHMLNIRRREDFEQVEHALAQQLFATAVERLKQVETVLLAYTELSAWLQPVSPTYARTNYEDLREQLAALIYPRFVREISKTRLTQYPRYLRAMRLRAERLRQDASRDQIRLLKVQTYWREYLKLKATLNIPNPQLDELRWLIEELRVSLFAQELKTPEPVSPKRFDKLLADLRNAIEGIRIDRHA